MKIRFTPCPKPEPKEKKKVYVLKRTPLKKKPYKIKFRSDKRAEQEKAYLLIIKLWLVGKVCPMCGLPATCVHHKKGRIGKLLTDVRFFLPVTVDCHQYIEEHPEWAKEQGYSLSRLETNE